MLGRYIPPADMLLILRGIGRVSQNIKLPHFPTDKRCFNICVEIHEDTQDTVVTFNMYVVGGYK